MTDEDRLILWIEEGRMEEALEDSDRILEANPDAFEIGRVRVQALLGLQRVDEALSFLETLWKQGGGVEVGFDRAEVLYELGRFERAKAACEELFPEASALPEAHYLFGLLLERAGELAEADEHFRRAHSLRPETFPVPWRFPLGTFLPAYEEAVRSLPDDVRDHLAGLRFEVLSCVPSQLVSLSEGGIEPSRPALAWPGGMGMAGPALLLFQQSIEHLLSGPEETAEILACLIEEELAGEDEID